MCVNDKSFNVNQWIMHTMIYNSSTVYDVENNVRGKMTKSHIIGQRHWKVTESGGGGLGGGGLHAKFGKRQQVSRP